MRFALLLWLVTLGALGLVACDDDGETATTETEVVTSDFAAGGRVAGALDPDACGDYDGRRPDGYHVRIQVLEGAVPCREAQRVLKNYYRGGNTPLWSCVGQGDRLVECEKPGVGAFAGHMQCRVWADHKAACLSRFGSP